MTVVAENEFGWFICCDKYLSKVYEICKDEQSNNYQLKFRDVFFDIQTPFFTDSKATRIANLKISEDLRKKRKAARVKKRCSKIQTEDSEFLKFIIEGTRVLVSSAQKCNYIEDAEVTEKEWFENNGKARTAASEVMNHINSYSELHTELICKNCSLFPVIRKFGDDEYILPPLSSFHLCDISSFFNSKEDEKYDLILLDPPWINKSVKRKKSYNYVTYEFLKNMPIEKLVNPGCLIVVWATNNAASSFVLNELFPKCNVLITCTWYWCKVTKKGNFMYPVDSHHKKPFEKIILGRVCYGNEGSSRPAKEINSIKLIVSVPSSIHSHKPPLIEILQQYLKPDAKCLELFARYLLPGWKSVGNEVIKLQNIKLFDKVEH